MGFDFSINPVLVGICTILPMPIGMLWYSPLLFSDAWMRAIGINIADIKESGLSSSKAHLASTFASLVLSFVMAVMVASIGLDGFVSGALLGLLAWLGFNFSSVFKYVFYEDRPWNLFLIDAGYDIICFVLIGGTLAQWQ